MNHQSNRQSFCAGVSHPPPRRAKPADGATRWLRKDAWAPRKKRSEMPMSRYVDESSACSAWQCKSKIKPHFVQGDSGDIHQQWLRDSSNQMRVYIPLAKASKPVADVFVNALKRMSQYFVGDTYASAFNPLPRDQMGDSSLYSQCPKSLECLNCTCEDCAPTCSQYSYQHNFELDSFCFTVDLAHRYWNATNDARAFDQTFHSALGKFVDLLVTEQDHGNLSPYRFRTNWTDQSAPNNHVAPPKQTAKVGLLWSDSRPSDDREELNYNIPQNMFATVALAKAAELASKIFNDPALAARATNLSASVNEAIELFGVFKGNLTVPRMYAFEVDGFGNQAV